MIKNQLFRNLKTIKKHLNDIQTYEYFNEASHIAIDFYQKAVNFLGDDFDEIEESLYQNLFIYLNSHFIPSLRYIQRSSTTNIPWSLIPSLNIILKKEFGEDYYLLFRPQWSFNFSVMTTNILDNLKGFLNIILPSRESEISDLFTSQKIHIFSFPYIEKNNVLIHSAIGHEIGHFYHSIWSQSDVARRLLENAKTKLTKYYRRRYPEDLMEPYIKTDEGILILKGMYREILSDICGYMIFGPSVIYALYYISSFEINPKLPKKPNYYPVMKYRIRILIEFVLKKDESIIELLNQNSEFSKSLVDFHKEIDGYLDSKNDLEILTTIQKEIDIFTESIPSLVNFAKKKIKNKYFNPKNSSDLFYKLSQHIPINELNDKPENMFSIIFVGWIYYYKINTLYIGEEYVYKHAILIRLLLKSVFSSQIHSEYLRQ